MLLVLPPSEGKAAAEDGPSLDLKTLSFPELNPTRAKVVSALAELCQREPDLALRTLKLSPTQASELERNTQLNDSACAPAREIYTGVLHDALALTGLPPGAASRANEQLVISSALWGLVRPNDPIPAYRLSAGVRLPGLPTLRELWRAPVTAALSRETGIIIDLRSTPYRDLAPLPSQDTKRTALVRVWQDQDGRRVAVSHFNKTTKGQLARALLRSRKHPQTLRQLASHVRRLGFNAEIGSQTPAGTYLDIRI